MDRDLCDLCGNDEHTASIDEAVYIIERDWDDFPAPKKVLKYIKKLKNDGMYDVCHGCCLDILYAYH